MLTIRRAAERGAFDHGWLDTRHTFSFARYFDPDHIGFRQLRVINEDRVAADRGFGTHRHDNMEIFSLVLDGQLEHKDSLGNGAVLVPGDFQYMSAGSGIEHSEFNPSPSDPAHFYQIWIEPDVRDVTPQYQQAVIDESVGGWQRLASGREGDTAPISFRQNAVIDYASVAASSELAGAISHDDAVWLQVIRGSGHVDRVPVIAGDGLAITEQTDFTITTGDESLAVLAFHLPPID